MPYRKAYYEDDDVINNIERGSSKNYNDDQISNREIDVSDMCIVSKKKLFFGFITTAGCITIMTILFYTCRFRLG